MDPIRLIQTYNAGRDPERLRMKYERMRQSTFAFLRGSCHLFMQRLPGGALKGAPDAWACGDLHPENFGSYKGDNRLVYFDINDFDEAALAPASLDPLRMLTGLHIALKQRGLRRREAAEHCAGFLEAYAAALALGKAGWMERDTAQGLVRELLDSLGARKRPQFLNARTTLRGKRRMLRLDGKRALPLDAPARATLMQWMEAFAATQASPAFWHPLDVARRIAGTGSLGVERYVFLVRGKGSPDGNYLLDLKRALPSCVPPHVRAAQPRWPDEAHRVVALQRRMQAVSAAFLQPVTMGQRGYVLRGLQPAEDRIAIGELPAQAAGSLAALAQDMGRMLAWAQLRSAGRQGSATADELIAFGQRGKWRSRLLQACDECADRARSDAKLFNEAFDDGALGV